MSWFRDNEEWLGAEDKKERMLTLREVFRLDVPGSNIGKVGLHHILQLLRFFVEAETEEDMYCQNAAKRLLRDLGIWDYGNGPNIVTNLGAIPPLLPESEELDDEREALI